MNKYRFVVLCALIVLHACPTAGYGHWDEDREGSILEAHESWTEETPATPATTPATATVPATVPATPPLTVPATAPATAPVTVPATAPATAPVTRPVTPPATPATIVPQVPLAPNQVPTVVVESPLPPSAPDCTLRLLTVFDWVSVSPTEGIAHYDIRKDMNVAWRAACEFFDATYTWTITGMPGVTTLHSNNITFTSAALKNLFTGADAEAPSKDITISLVISAARTKADIPVNPNPVTLHVVLYQPPQLVAPGTEYVVAPTTPVTFLSDLSLTFHKSAVKFGSHFSVSYAFSAAASETKYGFGTFKGAWSGVADEIVPLPVPITTAQQDALVGGLPVPGVDLWCYLYVQNDRSIGTYFGPFQVSIAGRAAVTDTAEREALADQILNDMFTKDPFAAVGYYLGSVGSALSEEKLVSYLERAYTALDDVVADSEQAPATPGAPVITDPRELIDRARAAKIAEMPPATQYQLIDSFHQLLKNDKAVKDLDSASSSGSSSGDIVSRESVVRALKVADMLLAVSLAVGTSGLTEAMKNALTAAIGIVLRLVTSYAAAHFGQVPPAAPTRSGNTDTRKFAAQDRHSRQFVSQVALDLSIRRSLEALENTAKAGITVSQVTKTASLCSGGVETLNSCYFFAESFIVDPGNYASLAAQFDGIADMGDLATHLSSLGHGTLIAMYTAINDQNLFDRTFDPALGVNPVRQYGGNARLELFLPLVGSARLQAGERLPVQLPEGGVAPKLVIPGLTQANMPQQFAITIRRSFTDTQWVKTSGSAVTAIDANTIAGSGYRIINYFWSIAAQPPVPAVAPPAVPGATPPSSPLLRPSVQPIAPLAPNTRSTVDKEEKDSNGTAIGVGVGVGVGACVLISLIVIALLVRSRNAKEDYTDPEFVVDKNAVWTVDPLLGQQENGHFAPPPTPLTATHVEQVVHAGDYAV